MRTAARKLKVKCPECYGTRCWRVGTYGTRKYGKRQRVRCYDCGASWNRPIED